MSNTSLFFPKSYKTLLDVLIKHTKTSFVTLSLAKRKLGIRDSSLRVAMILLPIRKKDLN